MNSLSASEQLAQIKALTRLAEKAIGERIGCSQPTVNRILKGQSDCRGRTLLEIQRWHGELQVQKQAAAEQQEGAFE